MLNEGSIKTDFWILAYYGDSFVLVVVYNSQLNY